MVQRVRFWDFWKKKQLGIGLKADAKGKIQNSEALEFGNGFFDWDDEKLRKQTSQRFFFCSSLYQQKRGLRSQVFWGFEFDFLQSRKGTLIFQISQGSRLLDEREQKKNNERHTHVRVFEDLNCGFQEFKKLGFLRLEVGL